MWVLVFLVSLLLPLPFLDDIDEKRGVFVVDEGGVMKYEEKCGVIDDLKLGSEEFIYRGSKGGKLLDKCEESV